MIYLKEVTVWDAPYFVPSHVYYASDDKSKIVGYIKSGERTLTMFKQPIAWDIRGRKFVQLPKKGEPDSVYFKRAVSVSKRENKPAGITVQGSGGKVYTLNKHVAGWTCTCPGYTYRRHCKHVESMPK